MIVTGRTLVGGLAAIALSAAACGGGGGSTTSSQPANSTAVASPVVTAPAAEASCPAASGLSGAVNDQGAAAATGATIEIEAGDSFFAPTCVTGTPRGTVSLIVKNTGAALHNVTIADQGIDKDVAPGETITVEFKVGEDAVTYVCKYHRTSGMVGAVLSAGS